MTRRADVVARLPVVLAYDRIQSAAACGVSPTTFDKMVSEGLLPPPIKFKDRNIWSVDGLRNAVNALANGGKPPSEKEERNPWDERLCGDRNI